ncbi:uncharacterized protein LOC123270512 isoform X1 [Cotesia glomerata]|uniref:uncharacterized protein LOC123270512 isoform X1 n=1 Tax=Cotesia glomerata TaxID=32391 RepID=UPI001D029A62|nr:uncharacterized protein LOC123270512 isoform X1 [Cotesia glomerata]
MIFFSSNTITLVPSSKNYFIANGYREAKFENVPQEILTKYLPKIQCYADKASCNKVDALFKSKLPEILVNNCLTCDEGIKREAQEELQILRQYFFTDFKFLLEKNTIPIVVNCLLNAGPCDSRLILFKSKLPFFLKSNECPDCTDDFINKMKKRIDYLKKFHPQKWQQIEQMFWV